MVEELRREATEAIDLVATRLREWQSVEDDEELFFEALDNLLNTTWAAGRILEKVGLAIRASGDKDLEALEQELGERISLIYLAFRPTAGGIH